MEETYRDRGISGVGAFREWGSFRYKIQEKAKRNHDYRANAIEQHRHLSEMNTADQLILDVGRKWKMGI